MFRKVFSKSLEVTIGDQTVSFGDANEFEFAIAGRIGLPAHRISALIGMGDEALLKEAEGIRKVEQKFSEVLQRSLEDKTSIGSFMKEQELAVISQDNDWRQIVLALRKLDSSYDEYRKIALVKYMQYLSARQESVKVVYMARQKRQAESDVALPTPRRRPAPIQPPPAPAADGDLGHLKETVIFDITTFKAGVQENKASNLCRLPKGETAEVDLEHGKTMAVSLAKHEFSVSRKGKFAFIQPNGEETELHQGKNFVGRDASCDVIIEGNFRDISRKHLIIELGGDDLLRFTDLSSLGTSIPAEYLDSTGI